LEVDKVGVLVAEKYTDKVVEVRKVSDRLLVLRVVVGKSIWNVVSANAPQAGRSEEGKKFLMALGKVVAAVSVDEKCVAWRDMNGHVGEKADGFESVHGSNGCGERNVQGEILLEFADAMELAVLNTWFKKDVKKRVTYESGGSKSQVSYILVTIRNFISKRSQNDSREECIQQHRLLICMVKRSGEKT
jgi:hypothetical protein